MLLLREWTNKQILSQAFGLTTKNLQVNGIDYENWETEASELTFSLKLLWSALCYPGRIRSCLALICGFYPSSKKATEQFDESLDGKIQALRLQQVEMSSIVAERRRKAPDQAKGLEDNLEMMKEAMEWDIEVDEQGRPRMVEDVGGVVLNSERESHLEDCLVPWHHLVLMLMYAVSVGLPPRHEETIETYKKTLTNLNEVLSVSDPFFKYLAWDDVPITSLVCAS